MKPFFLIGAERSGTTVLRLMLDSHPSVSWLNEFEYSVDRIVDNNTWPDIDKYIDYLSSNRVFQATGFTIDDRLEYNELIKSFLAQKQMQDSKPIIGATCHRHYDRLLGIFPDSRFIYLLRDPRDVARSNIGMGWAGNVWYGVDRWSKAEKLWNRVKSTLPKSSYIEVRFEELIAHPENVLDSICYFLDISYDPKMLSYPENTTYSLPDPKLIEQWKNKMTFKEIALVEAKVGSIMRSRGYQLLTNPIVAPSILRRAHLRSQNKIYRTHFRVTHYGLRHVLVYFIARKLRLRKLQRMCELQQNSIDKKHLK